jgi:hypothetical protein
VGGLLALMVSCSTSQQVADLSRIQKSSELIGDLTDNLTSKEEGRDVSLLALEYTLNPSYHEQGKGWWPINLNGKSDLSRSRTLLARIAMLLVNTSIEPAQEASSTSTTLRPKESEKFSDSIVQATGVLERILLTSDSQKCKQYFNAKTKLSENNNSNLLKIEEECEPEAERIALRILTNNLKGDSSAGGKASPSQLALSEVKDSSVAAPAVAQARVNNQLIRSIRSKGIDEGQSVAVPRAVITYHTDEESNKDSLRPLQKRLSDKGWLAVPVIRIVPATDKACAEENSVRFFHSEADELASALITDINGTTGNEDNPRLDELIAGKANKSGGITEYDLSKWKYAKAVPQQSMELWLVSKGKSCLEEKKKRKESNPAASG